MEGLKGKLVGGFGMGKRGPSKCGLGQVGKIDERERKMRCETLGKGLAGDGKGRVGKLDVGLRSGRNRCWGLRSRVGIGKGEVSRLY